MFHKLQSDHAEVQCSHMGLFFAICVNFHIFKILGYPWMIAEAFCTGQATKGQGRCAKYWRTPAVRCCSVKESVRLTFQVWLYLQDLSSTYICCPGRIVSEFLGVPVQPVILPIHGHKDSRILGPPETLGDVQLLSWTMIVFYHKLLVCQKPPELFRFKLFFKFHSSSQCQYCHLL
jgi:hypothetical protein